MNLCRTNHAMEFYWKTISLILNSAILADPKSSPLDSYAFLNRYLSSCLLRINISGITEKTHLLNRTHQYGLLYLELHVFPYDREGSCPEFAVGNVQKMCACMRGKKELMS